MEPANLLRLRVAKSIPKPAIRNISGAASSRCLGLIHASKVSRSGSPSQSPALMDRVLGSGLFTNPKSPLSPATIDAQGRPTSSIVVIGEKVNWMCEICGAAQAENCLYGASDH